MSGPRKHERLWTATAAGSGGDEGEQERPGVAASAGNGVDLRELLVAGIPAVHLENEWLRVVVLVGKGADVWELVYKPLGLDVLMKTKSGLEPLRGRDLQAQPLAHYAKPYPGGWQELLPNRAAFGDREIGAEREGESACVPWEYELLRESDNEVVLRCRVSLAETPLTIVKEFRLGTEEPGLFITEEVENNGADAVRFIWTHHPAFGPPLVDESAHIRLPAGCRAFQANRYEANRDSISLMSEFEEAVDAVTLESGKRKNLQVADPRCSDGEGCYVALFGFTEGEAAIDNPRLGIAMRLSWDLAAFPCLRYWSSNNEEMYTIALEPSSSRFSDIADAIRHGEAHALTPGERRSAWLNLHITLGAQNGSPLRSGDEGKAASAYGL